MRPSYSGWPERPARATAWRLARAERTDEVKPRLSAPRSLAPSFDRWYFPVMAVLSISILALGYHAEQFPRVSYYFDFFKRIYVPGFDRRVPVLGLPTFPM